jgi:hypothetical protein
MQVKSYQYTTVVIADPGHLDDPEFLAALNTAGLAEGPVVCPRCGKEGCAVATGFKRAREENKGSQLEVILLEREVISTCGDAPMTVGRD